MSAAAAVEIQSPGEIVRLIEPLKQKLDWEGIAQFAEALPGELSEEWLEVADEVAFALGQLRETDRAVRLLSAAYEVQSAPRRASSLAYLYYDACLQRNGRGAEGRDREADKQAFRHWMEAALGFDVIQVKNLYRLGTFEAKVVHRRDRPALRAFLKAIEIYRDLDQETRTRRHDLLKYYVKALYGGARSALNLRDLERARQLSFQCLREDGESNHLAPLHKLFLAGKICQALGQLDHAERAYRKALDAEGPPRRDFVRVKLAEVGFQDGRADDAERWIEDQIPPHRRGAQVWRLLGEVHVAQGRRERARLAFQNALHKDHGGRHLTLTALGRLQLDLDEVKDAEQSFRKALKFRQRRYLSVHREALEGLAVALERRGKNEEAAEARAQLVQERRRESRHAS